VEYVLTLLPVLLLVTVFYLLDSFKIAHIQTVALVFLSGSAAALIAYFFNTKFSQWLDADFDLYTRYIAPVLEESLKACFVVYLIRKKKIGFLIDAAIYGFTAGAGFAVVENLFFIISNEPDLGAWILRGFGTAIMHSGTTALLAILTVGALNLDRKFFSGFLPGLVTACLIHSVFNHFYVQPIIQTLLIVIIIPVTLILIFRTSENQLQKWLEEGFFNEAAMLAQMQKGGFTDSRSGQYLSRLKEHFPAETIVDMVCCYTLYLEFSVKSKRNLMLTECGLPVPKEPGLAVRLHEFGLLRKSIGKSGELAMTPLFRMKQRDFWQFNQLAGGEEETSFP